MLQNPSKSNRNSSRRPSSARGRVKQSTSSPKTRQRNDLRRIDNVSSEAVSATHASDSAIEETVPGFYGTHVLDHAFKANLARLTLYLGQTVAGAKTPPCIGPLLQDRRFRREAWQHWPFNLI